VTEPRPPTAILPALLVLGAIVRLWGIRFGLPHPMTRPDEEFIVSMALRFFSGDFNPHFFEWPSLYFYIVHLVFRAVYAVGHLTGAFADTGAFIEAAATDPTLLHLTLRVMSAASGVLTLLVVHGIAKALFDRTTALCGTAFLAVAYLHVRDSHFGVLDVPLTLLVASIIALLIRAWRRPHDLTAWVSAGVCAGLATSVKYNAAAVLVPALVAGALALAGAPAGNRRRILAAIVAFGVAFDGAFLIGSPYVLLDVPAFRDGLAAQVVRLTEGHGIRIDQVWMRHLTFSLRHGLGFPVLASALLGAVLLIARQPRTAAVLLAFPASYLLVIGTGHTAFIRYATPLVPFFCICSGYAVREVVKTSFQSASSRTHGLILAVFVAACAAPSLRTVVRFDQLLTAVDTRLLAAEWMDRQMKDGETLYESGASYARPHYALPKASTRMVLLEFEPARGVFTAPGGGETAADWIVVAESPLRLYTRVPPELRGILNAGYELVESVTGTTAPEREAAFDRQDAFFLPYADFSARTRPGPQLAIYRRNSPAR
jgi:Dolichyl-phosphate-mannose-protein mannosyltransferase